MWFYQVPVAGKAIGILAVVAGIISVRRLKAPGKVAWVALLIMMLHIEFIAIDKDHKDSSKQAAEDRRLQDDNFKGVLQRQNEDFKATVDALKGNSVTSAAAFNKTDDQVNGVLRSTKEVALLAKANLDQVSGGSSYPFVYPKILIGSAAFQLFIHNAGEQILTGVTLKILPLVAASLEQSDAFEYAPVDPINIGILAPDMGERIPNLLIPNRILKPDGTAEFELLISTQNGGAQERLHFRRSKDGTNLAFSFEVFTPAFGRRRKDDFSEHGKWYRKSMVHGWTEPVTLEEGLRIGAHPAPAD